MALIETRNARRPRKNDQRDANVRHLNLNGEFVEGNIDGIVRKN